MLRKFLNMLVLALLLVSTTGFSVSRHYCGNKLVDISVDKKADPCCNDSDCCHTETVFVKLNDDFTPSSAEYNPEHKSSVKSLVLQAVPYTMAVPADKQGAAFFPDESSPPQAVKTKLSLIQTYQL
jgi:hypothetical protein